MKRKIAIALLCFYLLSLCGTQPGFAQQKRHKPRRGTPVPADPSKIRFEDWESLKNALQKYDRGLLIFEERNIKTGYDWGYTRKIEKYSPGGHGPPRYIGKKHVPGRGEYKYTSTSLRVYDARNGYLLLMEDFIHLPSSPPGWKEKLLQDCRHQAKAPVNARLINQVLGVSFFSALTLLGTVGYIEKWGLPWGLTATREGWLLIGGTGLIALTFAIDDWKIFSSTERSRRYQERLDKILLSHPVDVLSHLCEFVNEYNRYI